MDDHIGNIDLIFRNGLRDYEVLPPADAWEGIKPSISTGTRVLPFMKVAAAALLMAVTSYAAYRWGSEVTKNQFSDTIASYQQGGYVLVNEPFDVMKPPAISVLPPENKAESVPDQFIMREAAIPEVDANEAGKNVTEFITADYNLLPGIQDPFIIKYPIPRLWITKDGRYLLLHLQPSIPSSLLQATSLPGILSARINRRFPIPEVLDLLIRSREGLQYSQVSSIHQWVRNLKM